MKCISVLLTAAACLAVAMPAAGSVLYSESFDYGNTTGTIQSGTAGNWTSGSGVVYYDAAGGLSSPAMGGTTGGAVFHDHDSGNRGAANSTDFALDFTGAAAGSEYWFAGLIQINNFEGSTEIKLTGGSVNGIGFGIDGSGNVYGSFSNNGGATSNYNVGVTLTSADLGSTYLFVIRGTKGTGTSPSNSQVDMWFNPADASSLATLGTPIYTTGTDSKFGREGSSNKLNAITLNLSYQSRADEIRVGNSLQDLNLVPEPATMALLGLGGLGILRRRRR